MDPTYPRIRRRTPWLCVVVAGLQESRVLTISNRADAERALASATWLSRPRVGSVDVAIEGIDQAGARALGAGIRRL
jgi:hypothetical protein